MFELIKILTELDGPVGQEAPVLAYMEQLWRGLGAEVSRTKVGNVIGRCGGSGPKVLLAAHADELCYLVRAVDPAVFSGWPMGRAGSGPPAIATLFIWGSGSRCCRAQGSFPA